MKDFLIDYCGKMNITLDEKQAQQFELYKNLLVEWNEKMNLTGITEDREVAIKHFADSLTALLCEDFKGKSVIDVGTGAGFPGLPLKIAEPGIKLTLMDSLNKRINFLNEVCTQLNLSDVSCIHKRAEEGGMDIAYREKFDICVSRAVASLNVLAELDLPFVKKGGKMLALKGPAVYDEVKSAEKAIKTLGGKVVEIKEIELPETDLKHNVIIIEKVNNTPKKYPRIYGKIKKAPL
jgi:16S rRNA (guanine527-N7)-methyltransferase